MKHVCLLKTYFIKQLSTALLEVVGAAKCPMPLKIRPPGFNPIMSRSIAILQLDIPGYRSGRYGTMTNDTQAGLWPKSRSASAGAPCNALYKSPQGECLPISSQGLEKLKNKTTSSSPPNNLSRAANGKCYSEANWGQPSVGTPWCYAAKW